MVEDPFAFLDRQKEFLLQIAQEVEQLIHQAPGNLDRFRQQAGVFVKKCESYLEGKSSEKQSAPYLLGPVLPQEDWGRLAAPESREDLLPDYYFLLTLIHDSMLPVPQFVPINNGFYNTEEDWVKCCCRYYLTRAEDIKEKAFIETALQYVKLDLAETLQGIAQKTREELSSEKPAGTEQKAKKILFPMSISLILIVLFILLVYKLPFTWIVNHQRSYGIQGSIICLIPCLIFGFFNPRWRKWCWGGAGLALLVGLLSLL